ncbi:MAG TPA: class 1 fructose-bisphosphatase [Candidatus Binataceae bacterium]
MSSNSGITLARYVMTKSLNADLAPILERIELAGKRIARELSVASLGGELGYTGATNVQGEKVKKLDQWGNDVFLETFAHGHPVCTLISEEMEEPRHYSSNCRERSFAVLYDPIDGSSNTDVNGSLGTIFSIRQRAAKHDAGIADILTPGSKQFAAGYVLYGPSTQLVYTAGAGVNIFTLDRSLGEFLLWRENIKMPPFGSCYAVNQGNIGKWHPGARKFVELITSRKDKRTSYSLRYTGAFVADFHRCLLEGGIYLYPGEVSAVGKGRGKLRLMYELAPMSMIAEQAGGRGSTGKGRILDVVPAAIHDRQPIYLGSADEVRLAEEMRAEG